MQNLFGFITHPMELGLIWIANAVGSAGIGIILFTIFVRLIISPLQITQLLNARKMQKIQPLIGELRQKHGKDRQKLSEETMKLYREHNVNPALGCLPTLLQFPVLIGLFYALLHLGNTLPAVFPHTCNGAVTHNAAQWFHSCYAVNNSSVGTLRIYQLFHADFLWLSNGLGQPDPLYILPILAGVTQWIQSRMMLTRSTDPQQQMMNTMMNFMPLMIVFFATRYPSGLSLYWVTSTLIGIIIQYRITGWGLLPETLGGLMNTIRGRGTPQKSARSTGSTAKQKPAQPSKATALPLAPVEGPVASDSETDGSNGSNGAGDPEIDRAVVRPRKKPNQKANRAKGGRGGRRG